MTPKNIINKTTITRHIKKNQHAPKHHIESNVCSAGFPYCSRFLRERINFRSYVEIRNKKQKKIK